VTALVHSELLKIRTTRSFWGYVAAIALLTGVGAATHIGSTEEGARHELSFQLGLVDIVGVAVVIGIILGITIVTNEFRHGTITPTFLVEPRRERVIGAKTVSGVLFALGFAVLAFVVIAAVAIPWLMIIDVPLRLGEGDVWTRVAEQLLAVVLWTLLGVAIGTVVQNQVAALVGTLIWIFVGENLLVGLASLADVDSWAQYLPFHALDAADGTGGDNLLSYGAGVIVSLAWIALLGAAGTWRTLRRDIT
jgi:ABC-type transport system involved in multi-copper enzyme maturation permease subunit